MDINILLLGSTDLTTAVARQIVDSGYSLRGIMSTPATFAISYSVGGMRNFRHVNLEGIARELDVPFRQYSSPDDIARFGSDVDAQLLLAAGWHHMIPGRVRDAFPMPCLGFHASLLPRYRGGAPLNWAILNDDRETGVTLFEIVDGVDAGLIYGQKSFPIEDEDDVGALVKKAEIACCDILRETLPSLSDGGLRPHPQTGEPIYTLQRFPEDGEINWQCDGASIVKLVRAVSKPYPGAFTWFEGRRIKIWRACVATDVPDILGAPGQIASIRGYDAAPNVVTGSGVVAILRAEFDDGADALPVLRKAHNKRFESMTVKK